MRSPDEVKDVESRNSHLSAKQTHNCKKPIPCYPQCGRCNRKYVHDARFLVKCQRCKACNKLNHSEVCCCTKNARIAREVLHVQDLRNKTPDATVYLRFINYDHTEYLCVVTLKVFDYPVIFKMERGDITIMSNVTFNRILHQPILTSVNSLFSLGKKLSWRGKFAATVKNNGTEYMYMFSIYVVERAKASDTLARNVAHELNLISHIDETNVYGSCELVKYTPMKISPKKDMKQYYLRTVLSSLLFRVNKEISKMEKEEIVEKVTDPTELCAPMVQVVKKKGKARIFADSKKLNEIVKR